MKPALYLGMFLLMAPVTSFALEQLAVVGTWNIEHLGSPGRGFGGGYGGGSLPARTPDQLAEIGRFIRDDLRMDILALQEIAVTAVVDGQTRNSELDAIAAAMGQFWSYTLAPAPAHPPPDQRHNMVVGFLYNTDIVSCRTSFSIPVPNLILAGASTADRQPLCGYFEFPSADEPRNDLP